MPRPKSDLRPVQIKLSPADIQCLDRIAEALDLWVGSNVKTLNRTEAIREAVKRLDQALAKKSKKISS